MRFGLLVVVVAGCVRAAHVGMEAAPAEPGAYGVEVQQAYARVRAATAPYRTIDSAVAMGYPATVAACLADSVHGAMGYHHVNRGYVDNKLEVERPEILLYERLDDGTYALNAVEYIVPYRVWPADSTPPVIMGRPLAKSEELKLWFMHMWIWRRNAAGLFADWNPAVKCRGSADTSRTVAYPEGYRSWVHIKSALIGPAHRTFATNGGFQHVYANVAAQAGYRTRSFPDGSVIVVDWLDMTVQGGAFIEGPRRQIDVMVRDTRRFAQTGGWGFQRFMKDSKTELAASPTPQQCFACHDQLKKDGLVLSSYRQ
jgi:hypothetical protein